MGLGDIDWDRPWLTQFRAAGKYLAAQPDWIAAACEVAAEHQLINSFGHPIRFLPQQLFTLGTPYEIQIAATGEVPTRNNLHDFFNTLIWLHFPFTKRILNQLQADALDTAPVRSRRGPQRDAATLFDENAAIVVSHDESLLAALREHEWKQVLQQSPPAFFSKIDVILFGHALLEKLVAPYKSITAHVWTIPFESSWFTQPRVMQYATLDRHLADELSRGFNNSAFCHLPVLGVPGWWHGQDDRFYADTEVFRPKRPQSSATTT